MSFIIYPPFKTQLSNLQSLTNERGVWLTVCFCTISGYVLRPFFCNFVEVAWCIAVEIILHCFYEWQFVYFLESVVKCCNKYPGIPTLIPQISVEHYELWHSFSRKPQRKMKYYRINTVCKNHQNCLIWIGIYLFLLLIFEIFEFSCQKSSKLCF